MLGVQGTLQIFLLPSVSQLWVKCFGRNSGPLLKTWVVLGLEGGGQARWIYPVGQEELPVPRQSHLQ